MANIFGDYTPLYNTFTGLLAKIAGTMVDVSKITGRNYSFVKTGKLPYGATIEDVFVQPQDVWSLVPDLGVATPNGYQSNTDYDPHGCDRIENPDILTQYFSMNYTAQTAVEVSDFWMRAAFTSANGISEYIAKLIAAAESGLRAEKLDKYDSVLTTGVLNGRDQQNTSAAKGYQSVFVNDAAWGIGTAAPSTAAHCQAFLESVNEQLIKLGDRLTSANGNGLGAIREDGEEEMILLLDPSVYTLLKTVNSSQFHYDIAMPKCEIRALPYLGTSAAHTLAKASFKDTVISGGNTATYSVFGILCSKSWLQDWETDKIAKVIDTPTAQNHFITEAGTVLASGVEPCLVYLQANT